MKRTLLLIALLVWLTPGGAAGQFSGFGQPSGPPLAEQVRPGGAARSAGKAEQLLSAAPLFVLRGVRLDGNTVLDAASVNEIIGPHLGKPASMASLEEIRRALTLLYIKRGYINSGVTIPDQDVTGGIIVFHAVEGRVIEIDVANTEQFHPDFFRARLERGLGVPFNVNDFERRQQILLQDPLLRRLNIELQPGLVPGEAKIRAEVLEAHPYSVTAQIADNQSPTVGEIRGQLQVSIANILGFGDVLTAQYGRSSGVNDGAVGYAIPLDSDDTRLSFRYSVNGTLVVTPALSPLEVSSLYDSISIGLSRPMYRTPSETLTIGAIVERRHSRTFLLGEPFSFTAGSENGTTNVTALRLYQEWLDRDAEHALALRSTASIGFKAFGATVTSGHPSGRFLSWLGQAQYLRRVYRDWEMLLRTDLQFANHPLFPVEQFALGGVDSVRGYRQYLSITDGAAFASAELRIPVAQLRLPPMADSQDAGTIQIVPFYDFGRGWNVARPTPYPQQISGVGGGVRWLIGSGTTAELYYAKPLRDVGAGTSLGERGIYFRLTTRLY